MPDPASCQNQLQLLPISFKSFESEALAVCDLNVHSSALGIIDWKMRLAHGDIQQIYGGGNSQCAAVMLLIPILGLDVAEVVQEQLAATLIQAVARGIAARHRYEVLKRKKVLAYLYKYMLKPYDVVQVVEYQTRGQPHIG